MNNLHFGVVVGINCYPGMSNQLTSARQDAEAFARWLTAPDEGGVPPDHVTLITASPEDERTFADRFAARPVRDEVIRALDRFHEKVAEVDDEEWLNTRIYLYVAGHGIAPPAGKGALLSANANPPSSADHLDLGSFDNLYATTVTPFREVVLLADCCREVVVGLPQVLPPPFGGVRFRGSTRRVLGFATPYSRMAAAPLDDDRPDDHNGRGFFTAAVLQGLRGGATPDPDTGAIRSDHLKKYAEQRVPELARRESYVQESDWMLAGPGYIEFARVRVEKYRVEFRISEDWGDRIYVRLNGAGNARTATIENGFATMDLLTGIYVAADSSALRNKLFRVENGDIVVPI